MSENVLNRRVPVKAVGALTGVLLIASLAFSLVVMQSLSAWVTFLSVVFSLFFIYLFYRFVLAVEKIANRL